MCSYSVTFLSGWKIWTNFVSIVRFIYSEESIYSVSSNLFSSGTNYSLKSVRKWAHPLCSAVLIFSMSVVNYWAICSALLLASYSAKNASLSKRRRSNSSRRRFYIASTRARSAATYASRRLTSSSSRRRFLFASRRSRCSAKKASV